MEKISFLILHYKNINETKECVKSILENIDFDNYEIVIVDNGSNNGTGEQIREIYKNKKNIHIIINEQNLGFARGNNIGFKYAKDILKTDFICMINSDTMIEQSDFCKKIITNYEEDSYHIAGIDIILNDGTHVNPIKVTCKNITNLKKIIRIKKRQIFLCKHKLEILNILYNRIERFKHKKQGVDKKYFQIHGAAIIFSPLYIKDYDGLYGGTFLYFEETILRYICDRDNLKMVYLPDIQIIHKESKTTKELYKNVSNRHMFYYKNSMNSCMALLKLINQDEGEIWKK